MPSKVPFIPFDKIKETVTYEQVMHHLGIPFIKRGNQYRAKCPVHGGGDRSLAVTPQQGFFCHAEGVGGDHIGLLSHVKGIGQYAAVKELAETFASHLLREQKVNTVPEERHVAELPTKPVGERGFNPLDYLDFRHETVQALGFTPDVAESLGIGHAPRGYHRGRVAIPVRKEDGTLVGYVSVTEARLPPKWHI